MYKRYAKYSTIHDFPRVEKPREKLIKYGPQKLLSEELLAIILRTGKKGKHVLKLAQEILKICDGKLANLTLEKLNRIDGIGPAKAAEIMAVLEIGKRTFIALPNHTITSPQQIWHEMSDIRSAKKEHFVAIYLNSRNQMIKKEVISVGTIEGSLVHPREVFEPAIQLLATAVFIVHNHPTGVVEPSEADIVITTRLAAAGELLGVDLLDHIIVGEEKWFSFKENGLMQIP